jgi:hypothetical protein
VSVDQRFIVHPVPPYDVVQRDGHWVYIGWYDD